MSIKRHFVDFYSPGTSWPEISRKTIESWDVEHAMRMADNIVERAGATPFAFQFLTREKGPGEFDGFEETDRSPMYFLGGRVETKDEILARNDPKDKTVIENLDKFKGDKIVINENSFKSTLIFQEGDVILDYKPPKYRAMSEEQMASIGVKK